MLNLLRNLFTEKESLNNDTKKNEIKIAPNQCLRPEQKDLLCHNCVKSCPKEAIDLRKALRLEQDKCDGCGICIEVCPSGVFSFPQAPKNTNISRRDFFKKFRNS
ncbi:MAG: indolepyruvate ferredoxin oxidoreductase subunit alpha [Candidatus Anammoxibacter sp.]